MLTDGSLGQRLCLDTCENGCAITIQIQFAAAGVWTGCLIGKAYQ